MATTTPLEQFSQMALDDAALQKQLLEAATKVEDFCQVVVKLAQEKGISLTTEDVFAATILSGYYYVDQLKPNQAHPRLNCGHNTGSNSRS